MADVVDYSRLMEATVDDLRARREVFTAHIPQVIEAGSKRGKSIVLGVRGKEG